MTRTLSTPPIETADLVVFAAAARLGSFSAAAVELRLSGPSVSTRLGALERRLGARLFERGARGSVLTPAGERLADYARRCLGLLDEAAVQVGIERAQRMVLAAPASLAATVFPPALRLLEGCSVAVHCRVAHSDEIVGALRDGTAHAGFLLANPPGDGVRSVRVLWSRMVMVGRPDHPLAARRRVRLAELAEEPVVVYRWGPEADAVLAHVEDPRRGGGHPVHTVGLPAAAVDLALGGDYLAVVPRFAAARYLDERRLRAIPVPLGDRGVEIRFAHPAGAGRRDGVRVLLERLPAMRAAVDGSGA
ncbi:LysR family transcriptional regulator [Pseudonocardia acaciae]|uniref:LysR family transcriptional regulator n=1 Tax=Pseudonocardia acaciae TaxID=551276 RepID=UPI00048DCBC4|nr:LysR family transcriptional regulator [Pseudonocardia acaciae]